MAQCRHCSALGPRRPCAASNAAEACSGTMMFMPVTTEGPVMLPESLLRQFDAPGPRYTSYPTADRFVEDFGGTQLQQALQQRAQGDIGAAALPLSVYVHIPFCASVCYYCACNKVITRHHERAAEYLDALEQEITGVVAHTRSGQPVSQLHFGGGSPTFLSDAELARVVGSLRGAFVIDAKTEMSIEVDPRTVTPARLAHCRALGFNRISFGVQDFDPQVQQIVNRLQPFEQTAQVTHEARALGYNSVNFDLIYGLPKQTKASIELTAQKTIELRPDRIALYSFALVPWIKPTQRSYKDEDLPKAGEKRALYELARDLLLGAGYLEIGMDHFALPHDTLAEAQENHTLHRNFMGYTELRTQVLLGLGVSAISETPTCFHQNEKTFPIYERRLQQGELPTLRGHLLNAEDRQLREQILVFMTQLEVKLTPEQQADAPEFLASLIEDGLVQLHGDKLRLTEHGLPFLRNACMFFDQRLRRQQPQARTFSQAM